MSAVCGGSAPEGLGARKGCPSGSARKGCPSGSAVETLPIDSCLMSFDHSEVSLSIVDASGMSCVRAVETVTTEFSCFSSVFEPAVSGPPFSLSELSFLPLGSSVGIAPLSRALFAVSSLCLKTFPAARCSGLGTVFGGTLETCCSSLWSPDLSSSCCGCCCCGCCCCCSLRGCTLGAQ